MVGLCGPGHDAALTAQISTVNEDTCAWHVVTTYEKEDLAAAVPLIPALNNIQAKYASHCSRIRALLLTHNLQVIGRQRQKWYSIILLAAAGKQARAAAAMAGAPAS